jgi:hypothetical protein
LRMPRSSMIRSGTAASAWVTSLRRPTSRRQRAPR